MIKERFAKLLCVKSIVTIVLTAVFAYLAITGAVSSDQVQTTYSVIVAFYFGTQYERKNAGTTPVSLQETQEVGK